MKRVVVSMCVYTLPGNPAQHTGVLLEKDRQKTVIDLETLAPVKKVETYIPIPGAPQFDYAGFNPETRKLIKESRRLVAMSG